MKRLIVYSFVLLLLVGIVVAQSLDKTLEVIIPENSLIAKIPGNDLLDASVLGKGALARIFAGGDFGSCDERSLFYGKSKAIQCDKIYLDYENENSAALVEEDTNKIVVIATKEAHLDPFRYLGFVGEDPVEVTNNREARLVLDKLILEKLLDLFELKRSGVDDSTFILGPATTVDPETGRTSSEKLFDPILEFGRTESLGGLGQIEDYEGIFNSIAQTSDPALFIGINTQEGWKFYWLLTITRDRYNVQKGWESILSHILIDAKNPEIIFLEDITPRSFMIGYSKITDKEKNQVMANTDRRHLDFFLSGEYTSVEKFDGSVVCVSDVITSTLCATSTEDPASKDLFSISNEDSSIIVDAEGNLIFVSSESGEAFRYLGFIGEFADVNEAHEIALENTNTNDPLKISFVGVKRNEEFRLLYVFYNHEALKIIDAKTGGIVI